MGVNLLLLTGITLFAGTMGGKIAQRLKIPQVTGYILAGLILGKTLVGVWTLENIEMMQPLVNVVLGIIGFLIGSELKREVFQKRGKSIYSILIGEGVITFVLVTAIVTLVTKQLYLGLLLGAVASATDPASTADVLWENKTRGPLTATLLAIVALDDVLALLIYAFASMTAKMLITHEHYSLWQTLEIPLYEIGAAAGVGLLGGAALYGLLRMTTDRKRIMPFALSIILAVVGLASVLKLDLILATMLVGCTFANLAPLESEDIVDQVKRFSMPFYILFFGLVGARLDLNQFAVTSVLVIAVLYLFGRSFGKLLGAFLGGLVSKAPKVVTKYLGFGLFAQAGVAIGLAISIQNNLSHISSEAAAVGATIVNVVVATTFVVQLLGPLSVKWAVHQAGEIGKNVSEEDIIETLKVGDLLEKEIPSISEDMHLDAIVEKVKNSDSLDFCVVDKNQKLLGIISLGDLRDVLLQHEQSLDFLVLARDIARPVKKTIAEGEPLQVALDNLRRFKLDFLPVIKNDDTAQCVGMIHYRHILTEIEKEYLKRRA